MNVTIFGRPNCDYCAKAVMISRMKKIEFDYKNINEDKNFDLMFDEVPQEIRESIKTVPQIFVDGEYIGGFMDYEKFLIEKAKSLTT